MEGGKESEDEADAECLYCVGLFSEDRNGEDWVLRVNQCFSTAGPRPGTEPWHQL